MSERARVDEENGYRSTWGNEGVARRRERWNNSGKKARYNVMQAEGTQQTRSERGKRRSLDDQRGRRRLDYDAMRTEHAKHIQTTTEKPAVPRAIDPRSSRPPSRMFRRSSVTQQDGVARTTDVYLGQGTGGHPRMNNPLWGQSAEHTNPMGPHQFTLPIFHPSPWIKRWPWCRRQTRYRWCISQARMCTLGPIKACSNTWIRAWGTT